MAGGLRAGPTKVLCVFGTRPEAIETVPVVHELRKHPARADVRVCVTGQHRQMLDQVLRVFEIVPDYDLEIMRPDQSLTEVTVEALTGLDALIASERPEWVVVQYDHGDGSGAAFYHRARITHVEAGLRSGDPAHPFPEET